VKISIVTPSFQQAGFLEPALRSVLDQNFPDLEYIVADGGSTDGSADIIRKYADRLHWWVSERDGGQFDAINKGFAHSTGEIMGWLNSDDMLTPWSLSIVEEIFRTQPEVEWISTLAQIRWDAQGRAVRCLPQRGFSRAGFLAGENLPRPGELFTGWIQQESTFWRRSLWDRAGGRVGSSFSQAGDFDLWARFFQHAELYGVDAPLGGFRYYGNQKTGAGHERYVEEALRALEAHGGRPRSPVYRALRRFVHESAPKKLRSLAGSLGLLHPVKLCRHHRHSGQWQIVTDWN
jgi:hypothetical protein